MLLTLNRFCVGPLGTFGTLTTPSGRRVYSVEKQWRNNEPFVSCVPEGEYALRWYDAPRWGRTLALEGGTVGIAEGDAIRWAVLFHRGNYPRNFQGCIGLGRSLGASGDSWCVWNTDATIKAFLSEMSGLRDARLRIKFGKFE